MKWDDVIKRVMFIFDHREGVTYCLGCAGEVAGRDDIVRRQFIYYYDHGWKEKIGEGIPGWVATDNAARTWEKWLNINRGKMCFDCSGLICWACGYEGRHVWSSWNLGNMEREASPSAGVAGSVLWKSGHVGLDIGYGYEMEIGSYNNTIEFHKIGDRGWTRSCYIDGIDYTGADAR